MLASLIARYRVWSSCIMSHVMRNLSFCICENKGASQLHSNYAANKHCCFHYIDSKCNLYFLNLKFQALAVQLGLCRIW